MLAEKFWKRKVINSLLLKQNKSSSLTKVEETAAQIIIDLQNSSSEFKQEFSKFFLDSVKEIEITSKDKKQKNVILIVVPFFVKQLLNTYSKRLITEYEKRFKTSVLFMLKRTILSKWIKANKSQRRPRNRTLTSVHDNILEDLLLPAYITGRRIRCKIDGTKYYKIQLDEADRAIIEDKLDAVNAVYKKLTHKDITFEFKEEKPFYSYHQ